jgi:hypothetical protein
MTTQAPVNPNIPTQVAPMTWPRTIGDKVFTSQAQFDTFLSDLTSNYSSVVTPFLKKVKGSAAGRPKGAKIIFIQSAVDYLNKNVNSLVISPDVGEDVNLASIHFDPTNKTFYRKARTPRIPKEGAVAKAPKAPKAAKVKKS